MATNGKIRVGIVGVSPNRGFASIAHIPALQALPEFEIAAVCTTRQESAEAAARHFGIPLAFSDPEKLAQHPDVDLVTVSVKVPDHYRPVMAAIEAGKHVYCEWPLGRNTAEAHADARCGRTPRDPPCGRTAGPGVTGDQLRQGPGRPGLCRAGADGDDDRLRAELGSHDRPRLPGRPRQWRQPADDHRRPSRSMRCAIASANFASLPLLSVSQRDRIPLEATGEIVAKTAPDQLVVNGIVGDGAVVSFQIRGGMARGIDFLFEIHGEEGDLVRSPPHRAPRCSARS